VNIDPVLLAFVTGMVSVGFGWFGIELGVSLIRAGAEGDTREVEYL
jgi:hypothetical protein